MRCEHLLFARSCLDTDVELLIKQIFLDKNTNNCSLAIRCLVSIAHLTDQTCRRFCSNSTCVKTVSETCPMTVVLGLNTNQLTNIHFVFEKTQNIGLLHIYYKNSFYDRLLIVLMSVISKINSKLLFSIDCTINFDDFIINIVIISNRIGVKMNKFKRISFEDNLRWFSRITS